jgi:hypothetical protein
MVHMFSHMLQVYVPNVLSASDLCRIQVFHVASVSEVYSKSYGGTARALGKGAWRAEGWQMGRKARLGSRRWGVLVLIRVSWSRLRGERRGSGEGVAGVARQGGRE